MYTIYPVGERALAIQWGEGIDEQTNDAILGIFQWLKEKKIPGVTDLIPAYQTLTLVYDPVQTRRVTGAPSAYEWLYGELRYLLEDQREMPLPPSRRIDLPVCYDPSLGPDQEALCRQKGVSPEVLVELHTRREYKVYMIGFLPGFAYMGMVDDRIAVPRKREPAKHIPPGSVGIAAVQTGIYPVSSPGGWHIIGRTPLALFDPASEDPVFFRAGDRVRFVPITLDAYYGYTGH
ncbi:5-oxoprolinase subunit PxpB [Dinghuibacter silviterrae]|uniref:Inhibitor of KinA n=1 Tax=Dinghuibacter silviterrae TaxID=1539049 RepID=A0A4R8DMM5_9BACT|nr:5-oxoprolinase subunit PxpB [Dinghuibacter silviterrae]TDW99223.1 inhibitor of KinA [Dinghuibacter silviterrae]